MILNKTEYDIFQYRQDALGTSLEEKKQTLIRFDSTREGTPGRHEPPPCQHESPRFKDRPSLRHAARASAVT